MIEQAFKLLKGNGILVYSTCSFCESQNENVVRHLLSKVKGKISGEFCSSENFSLFVGI